jgi:acetyl-CoA C-acetyltransferase
MPTRRDELRGSFAAVGIGEVPTGVYPDRSALDAAMLVAREAVRDSGVPKEEIDVVMTTGAIFNPEFNADLIFSRLVEELGLTGTTHTNMQVMAGGASSSVMFKTAGALVTSGLANHVLVIASDKLATGMSTADAIDTFARYGIPAEWERPYGQHFSAIAALIMQRYQHETGTTAEQLASVCVSLRTWACLNPNAMYRKPLTVDEVLSSKMLSEPLHAKESNMLADGAAAFVVTTAERARELTDTPVFYLGSGGRVTHYALSQEPDMTRFGWAQAGHEAFAEAGIDVADIDIAEIYDSYAIFNLICLEELGFVERGEAGAFVEAGHTSPGGKLPMTTNGGMLSQGHTAVGGGVAILVETIRQLQGRAGERQVPGARLAVETSVGGSYMDAQVLVLSTEVR